MIKRTINKLFPALLATVLLLIPTVQTVAQATAALPRVSVKGACFVQENGDTLVFRGLSISDPDKIKAAGRWSKRHFEIIKSWGAQLVRIPVHPSAWRARGEADYLKMLDEAVQWCTELGMYVIIDWHSIGNLQMELFQDPMYDTTKKETFTFWRTMARRYGKNPTVAFFELYNEPTIYNGELGQCTWAEWQQLMVQCIDLVRANGAEAIPLLAGFDWAYDLQPIHFEPIPREGVAYVTHPYPGKNKAPREGDWERHFGFAAGNFPIIATEVGFCYDPHGPVPLPDDGIYTKTLLPYLKSKNISWVAWVFDPSWEPPMLKDWNGTPTAEGEYWRKALLDKP